IQVAKKFVEAVDSGQKLIEIAEMILAELAGGVALRFERGGDSASLSWYAHLGSRLADSGHARANGKFAHDKVRATCCATRFRVVVREQHSFLGHLVEVGCPPGHHAAMVSADVPHADIIAHDEQDIGFLV